MQEGAANGAIAGLVVGVLVGAVSGGNGWEVAARAGEGMLYGEAIGATAGVLAPESQRLEWKRVWPAPAPSGELPQMRYPLFRAASTSGYRYR
jgi:hypothetical protein